VNGLEFTRPGSENKQRVDPEVQEILDAHLKRRQVEKMMEAQANG